MQNRKNYALALDPSLSETGYALMSGESVFDCGTFKFSATHSESFKLNKLAEGLRQLIHKFGPQEVAITKIVKPITKLSGIIVLGKREKKLSIKKAYRIANSGIRGPVWLDIPLDVQGAKI